MTKRENGGLRTEDSGLRTHAARRHSVLSPQSSVLFLLLSASTFAAPPASQPRTPPPPPATQPRRVEEVREFPSLKDAVAGLNAPLDKDLATRIMKRQDVPAGSPQLAGVDLGIDVRVVQRWLLAQAAVARPESEAQVGALLRSNEMAAAIAGLERDQPAGWTPTKSQLESLARLHKLTFELGDLKDAAQLDDVARRVGSELTIVSSATPIDPRTLPVMRPSRVQAAGDDDKPATREALRSVATLQAEAARVAVAASLRRQLMTIGQAAATADEKESAALHQALAEGVDLARGLSGTSAFTADAKEQIETSLAEGLALVSDPRTRAAGEDRIQALNEYRQVMNRIAKSTLPADLRSALAPAFAYAQTHAAEGARVLNLVEEFTQIVGRVDALPKRENPVSNLKAPTTEVAKQFAAARQAVVSSANDLGGVSGGGVGALADQIGDLRELADLYVTLSSMQQTYDVLNAYKPRPYGMIEQRATRAATVASSATRSPLRGEGIKFLNDLTRLARLSEAVTQKSLGGIPPAVLKDYAGVSTAEFSAKVKLLMADLINSAAAGQEPDRRKIDRLNAVDQLVESLHDAAAFEQNLDALPALQKWVDWAPTADQLRSMTAPYQQLVSNAFSGFVGDTPDAIDRFLRQRNAYTPVIAFVARAAKYADACAALPEGLQGDLARLMTPMHDQAFATERYVSFAVTVYSLLNDSDPDAAQVAADFAARRLQREFARRDAPKPATRPAAK